MSDQPLRVMVVDDSPIIRAVLAKCLRLTGLDLQEVVEAGNGNEALAAYDDGGCDLLLTDIHMPEATGLDLLDGLKQRGRLDNLPVIIISSDHSDGMREQLASRGVQRFLTKPFTPESVHDAIVAAAADV